MRTVETIPARPPELEYIKPKRVAAYCRVSTAQEIQCHSLEAQREYYEKYINGRVGWTFVGIYADQASGRCNRKMRDFQRMLADCKARLIDLILVKSISRLGRNTVEFLNTIQAFNAWGVDVYFEVEKLHGSNPVATKLLTIYASLYQQESETKSHATAWGHHVRFQDGSSRMYDLPCYGYRRDVNGKLEIDPTQAAVVRKIFALRKEGSSLRDIVKALGEDGIPSPQGDRVWSVETVRRILASEKYHGSVVLGKTYVADYFKCRRATNRGEMPKYRVDDHHEAIIEPNG